jgi:hypothetical protein
VDFEGAAMKFIFDGFSRDWWSFGFCREGGLAEWRERGER